MATIAELRADRARLAGRALGRPRSAGRHTPDVDGRLGAVGYCFGGMTVLEIGARRDAPLAGAVSVHGTLATPQPAAAGAIRAKILVCHGALDPHVPTAQVTAFADEMRDAGADWQLIVYGGAMHGFTHEHADPARTPGRRVSRAERRAIVAGHPRSSCRSTRRPLPEGARS